MDYGEFMLNSLPPLIAARAQLGDELVYETYMGWVNDSNEAGDWTLLIAASTWWH